MNYNIFAYRIIIIQRVNIYDDYCNILINLKINSFKKYDNILDNIFHHLDVDISMTYSIQLCDHDPHTTISKEKTFLQEFLVILKRMLQILEEMFP